MSSLATIKDVARAARVHFTTAARAFRDGSRIAEATRSRVLAAAARIGYRRDPVFLALSARRAPIVAARRPRIALVANRAPEEGFFRRAYYRRLELGARVHAEELGYDYELLFLDRGHHDSPSLQRHLRRAGIRGVIVCALEASRRTLELEWSELCGVEIDSRQMSPALTFVSSDQAHYTRLAFRRMRALGYRRVGMAVGSDDELTTDDQHTCAYFFEQSMLPSHEKVAPLFFPPGARTTGVRDLLARWIRHEAIDGVISNWTIIARLIRNGGIDCPGTVGCASMCMDQPCAGLAGVVTNHQLVGGQAAGLLAALMRNEQYGVPTRPTSTYVEGFWRDGASAPARAVRKAAGPA